MSEPKHPLSLEELSERLKAAQGPGAKRDGGPPQSVGSMSQALGMAFRAGVELVAAFVVALGIGWLVDYWLGTRPWFLVVFFFLGAATAFMNVMRVARGMGLQIGFPKSGETQSADDASSKDKRS
jgi:ATP synthase protein I